MEDYGPDLAKEEESVTFADTAMDAESEGYSLMPVSIVEGGMLGDTELHEQQRLVDLLGQDGVSLGQTIVLIQVLHKKANYQDLVQVRNPPGKKLRAYSKIPRATHFTTFTLHSTINLLEQNLLFIQPLAHYYTATYTLPYVCLLAYYYTACTLQLTYLHTTRQPVIKLSLHT